MTISPFFAIIPVVTGFYYVWRVLRELGSGSARWGWFITFLKQRSPWGYWMAVAFDVLTVMFFAFFTKVLLGL